MKAVAHQRVAVTALPSDEPGKTLMVTCCLNPDQGYASKNLEHAGFVHHDQFVPDEKGPKLSDAEIAKVLRAYGALRVCLNTIDPP